MSNFQLDSTLEAIFGERPEITTKRASNGPHMNSPKLMKLNFSERPKLITSRGVTAAVNRGPINFGNN